MVPPPPARLAEPFRIGPLELPSRFCLAPLAGYTNLPMRLSVREQGGLGLATTDLINARAICDGVKKTRELLATAPGDTPLAVQIFGSVPDEMATAARWLVDFMPVSAVDINMGCPVRKVVKNGGGSAMMCNPAGTVGLVARVVNAVPVPVTVKMRLGWDDENLTAPYFAREFERVGVAAVTIHGRTREQGFGGRVNRDGIRAVVGAVERIPVVGNGDVRTLADAHDMFTETGCAAVAIGRGALANPWVFRQLDRWARDGDPGPTGDYFDRLDFMALHLRRLIEWRGGDRFGCVHFRKIAPWYCRTLRTGKAVQHRFTLLDSWATFEELVGQLRAEGPPRGWQPPGVGDAEIAVPAGPIAHW